MCYMDRGNIVINYIKRTPDYQFVIEFSMQEILQQACAMIGIEGWRYTLQDVKQFSGHRPILCIIAN